MNFVVYANGLLIIGLGSLMSVVAVFFPASRTIFFETAILAFVVGLGLCLSTSARRGDFRRIHSFALTGSAWLTAAAAGALPLWLWGLSPVDAFFESMSGITTTGSTVMSGLDNTERGILLWRALLQWIGGIGFIVAGIALLPIMRVGGMQLFRTESSERGDKEMASATRFAAATIWVYAGLTLACLIAYASGGMSGFEAAAHALTTVSTGGYSTSDLSFGLFQNAYLEWTATAFMLAGAVPFAWYIRLLTKGTAQSEQVRDLLFMLLAVIAAMTAWRLWTSDASVHEALRQVSFNVVSVVTTTGYATTDYTAWGPFAVVVFFGLTALGGCTGSTSGGAKQMRLIILARSIKNQVRQIHSPHGVFRVRYEGNPVEPDVLSGVATFFAFYGGTVVVLAVILTLIGLDLSTAVSGALTAVANVGPGVGEIIGPAGNFSTLPDAAKWVLSFGMYAGRLEMLTVFVLLFPTYWREAV